MAKNLSDTTSELKQNLEAVEKLRAVRQETRKALTKEGLSETEEAGLASRLAAACSAIATLEQAREALCTELKAAAAAPPAVVTPAAGPAAAAGQVA